MGNSESKAVGDAWPASINGLFQDETAVSRQLIPTMTVRATRPQARRVLAASSRRTPSAD
jgi:hypothetical protein